MRKLDIKDSIGTLIVLTSKLMEQAAEHEIKNKLGLTSSQWKIILALNLFDGLSQKELADKIYVDSSTLVPVIDKMETSGLIERRPDPKDRRHNRIFLTKKSESTVDSIIKIILHLRKALYRGMSHKDRESMRPHLKKIINNADKILDKTQSGRKTREG
ncbi:MAG: MarR family transcriptional regulator [Thaumarchaeota archaeon]|nr:MarR family transcriptional regulator [Nitrososphaerota archaeon]